MSTIAQAFSKLGLSIDDYHILNMERLVIGYEIKKTHTVALNSQTLGVHPITFLDGDRQAIFDLWKITEEQMRDVVRLASEIDLTRKVTSDPFNLLCAWLLHLAVIYIPQEKIRMRFQLNVAKYLHYRFFTSVVNHHLPHGAIEAVMTAVINSLTRKFDIITYGSWRKTLEARCQDLIAPDSIHYHTIQTAAPDKLFLYILSDVSTRITDKVKTICEIYYQYHKSGTVILSKPATNTDLDGEKIVVSKNSVFDVAISNLTTEILNVHQFVDRQIASQVASQFQSVSTVMLCAVLTEWSALATDQIKSKRLDYVDHTPDGPLYIGARALITAIIQTSLRYCINNRIPLTNRSQVWINLKNVYSSSRVSTPDILAVKQSVEYFVDSLNRTKRDSTKASLRLAVILFCVYKCFRYLK